MTLDPAPRFPSLFRYLEPEEARCLLDRCDLVRAEAGEYILRAGDAGDRMYLVEEGWVEVIDDRLGEAMVLAEIGPGSLFGEIAVVDGQERTKDVRARTRCRLRVLRRDDLAEISHRDPDLAARISRGLAEVLSSRLRGMLRDDDPLVRYVRRIRGARPAGAARPAGPASERRALEHLYAAIRRARRELFQTAESAEELPDEEILRRHGPAASAILARLLDALEEVLQQDPGPGRLARAKRMFFQEMYPCLMRSPTADLGYLKPRGYPLDHLVLERIEQGEAGGADAAGLLVDRFVLDLPLLAALRRRPGHALSFLREAAGGAAPPARVVCLGAGTGAEAVALLAGKAAVEVTCVDADEAALERLAGRARQAGVREGLRLLREDPLDLIDRSGGLPAGAAQALYSLHLLDRLEDREAARLLERAHEALAPGGQLYLAGTSPDDPSRTFAEVVLEWPLVRRTPPEMGSLLGLSPFDPAACAVHEDPEGLNLALTARRAPAA